MNIADGLDAIQEHASAGGFPCTAASRVATMIDRTCASGGWQAGILDRVWWRSADEIYRHLAPRVVGYMRARGAEDPEDLTGEVFLQVARDLPRFRGRDDGDAVRRWVFSIARNRMVDAGRRARRRPARTDAEVPDVPGPIPAEEPDPELLAALAELTTDQREVLALRFVADLSLENVAELTKRSIGATKALQHRALENLRATVSPTRPPTL